MIGQAMLMARLQRLGLSSTGAQQVAGSQAVTNSRDRQQLSQLFSYQLDIISHSAGGQLLKRSGVSDLGIHQIAHGNILSNAGDRHALAQSFVALPQPSSVAEIYDFPGEYAQRFDEIDKGGG